MAELPYAKLITVELLGGARGSCQHWQRGQGSEGVKCIPSIQFSPPSKQDDIMAPRVPTDAIKPTQEDDSSFTKFSKITATSPDPEDGLFLNPENGCTWCARRLKQQSGADAPSASKPKPQIMSGTWKRSCGPAAELHPESWQQCSLGVAVKTWTLPKFRYLSLYLRAKNQGVCGHKRCQRVSEVSFGRGCAALSGLAAGGCSRLSAHDLASLELLTITFLCDKQGQRLLGDYHSLGAAELVWAQTGDAWQTVVAGVSLPGLKD
ncbi:hypothetical protein NQZ68_001457 [Dissostichus eleginoides]|nr:hypothetical protein NQZ68_001457 [Dissostichus eleginoides]